MRLTKAMIRELRYIDEHGEPCDPYEWSHAPGPLWFYARDKVLGALLDRGLILDDDNPQRKWVATEAGKAALAAL